MSLTNKWLTLLYPRKLYKRGLVIRKEVKHDNLYYQCNRYTPISSSYSVHIFLFSYVLLSDFFKEFLMQ